MKFLLDTSICIPLINRTDRGLKARLVATDPSSVVLCSVVKAELHFGAQNSAHVQENLDRVERFCEPFDSLPFDDRAAFRYGEIRTQLRREGQPIGANDLLIASIALASGATLVTRNLDEFKRVHGLLFETW